MRNVNMWLLLLAIPSGIGGVACTLQWLGIQPRDLAVMTIPGVLWLVFAIALFAVSLGASIRALYVSVAGTQRHATEVTELRGKLAEETNAKNEREGRLNQIQDQTQKQLRDEIGAKMLAHGKLEQLQPRLDETQKELEEQRKRADQQFTNYNNEVQEHQRTKALLRDANTFRTKTDEQLADCQKRLKGEPQPIPTGLRLVFKAEGTAVESIETQNIWRWYTLQHVINHMEEVGKQPKVIRSWTLYLSFESPVAIKQLLISASGPLPTYEIKECNSRYAIIAFAGDIVYTTVEIRATV